MLTLYRRDEVLRLQSQFLLCSYQYGECLSFWGEWKCELDPPEVCYNSLGERLCPSFPLLRPDFGELPPRCPSICLSWADKVTWAREEAAQDSAKGNGYCQNMVQ